MATVPSPFEPPAPGVDAKTTGIDGGAKPISGPGAMPEPAPQVVPVPKAPAPAAPAPAGAAQAAPAPPVAAAAPAAPAPAPTAERLLGSSPGGQQMVPAYVAKAMERQAAKIAKENAMVPAPDAATAPPPKPQSAPVATPQTAAPPPPPTQTTQPPPTQGAQETQPEAPAPAPAAQTGLDPDPTDAPDVAAQKQTAAQRQAELMEQAKQWMTSKEDPAFLRQFNQAMLDTAVQNQAAIDATKRMIAQNPSLRGQPAGDALLGLKAAQLGMEASDLKANLSVAHARAVAEMNRIGFDAYYKLHRDQMTQDERDIELYGAVMDRMISSGADEATLRAYYDKNIAPLLGDKDITFDQFRSPAERQRILAQVQDDGLADMRAALDRGDDAAAIAALQAAYAPTVQAQRGQALIDKNDIETINEWLDDAGFDTVESAADLIDREGDVFVAEQISKARRKLNESPLQPKVDALLKVLQGRGMDITDPGVIDAVEEYIYQQEFGDPEKPNLMPWDDDATSWKYKDWEIFNPATGAVISEGGEFYDETNPEPQPGSEAYEWTQTLNREWGKYLNATRGEDRLSRDEWFAQVKEAYTGKGGTLDEFFASGEFEPGKPKVDVADRPGAINEGRIAVKKESNVTDIDFDDPNVKAYLDSLPALLPAQIGRAKSYASDKIGEWISYGGQYYRIDSGHKVWTHGSQAKKRHHEYMALTDRDGNKVYMSSDGRITTTPPPDPGGGYGFKDRDAFKKWIDSMEAP